MAHFYIMSNKEKIATYGRIRKSRLAKSESLMTPVHVR